MTNDEEILKELKEDLETVFPQTTLGLLERYFETKFGGNTPEPVDKGYKELIGYLTQSETNAPVFRIIHSDFDETPFFARVQAGVYTMIFPTIKFDVNKVLFQNTIGHFYIDSANQYMRFLIFRPQDSDEENLYFRFHAEGIESATPVDNTTTPIPFNLRIYN